MEISLGTNGPIKTTCLKVTSNLKPKKIVFLFNFLHNLAKKFPQIPSEEARTLFFYFFNLFVDKEKSKYEYAEFGNQLSNVTILE